MQARHRGRESEGMVFFERGSTLPRHAGALLEGALKQGGLWQHALQPRMRDAGRALPRTPSAFDAAAFTAGAAAVRELQLTQICAATTTDGGRRFFDGRRSALVPAIVGFAASTDRERA